MLTYICILVLICFEIHFIFIFFSDMFFIFGYLLNMLKRYIHATAKTKQMKAVLNWFWEAESVIFIQQKFRKQFQPEPFTYLAIMTVVKGLT